MSTTSSASGPISGLDFEDLELLTRDLLAGDESLQEHYAGRFATIMVDELQDTNAVQLALIESIARENLFTVGDAQQSIYGFRHADVALFRARGERLAAGRRARDAADQLPLASRDPRRAGPCLRGRAGGELHGVAPGQAGARSRMVPAASRGSSCCVVDKGADWELEGLAAPWRLAEARLLAERVAELVAGGAAPGRDRHPHARHHGYARLRARA